jgi:uncharacterized protein YkwD
MKEKKAIFRMILVCAILGLAMLAAPMRVKADDFAVTGTFNQTDARNSLKDINAFRTGSDAWYWNQSNSQKMYQTGLGNLVYDYDLEQIAMQRAVEIALTFEHTRPDGTSWFTARYNGTASYGENIAAGYASAHAAYVGFREDNEKYAGQGHRRNMLDTSYKAVGLASFTYNGITFFVQEFSSFVKNTTATTALNGTGTRTVSLDMSKFSPQVRFSTDRFTLSYLEETDMPVAELYLVSASTFGNGLKIPKTTYTCSVTIDTPDIASSSGGKITGRRAGDGSISAAIRYNGVQYTETITLFVSTLYLYSCDIQDIPDCNYTGG